MIIAPHLTCRPIPECPVHPTAFNNTAVQFVLARELGTVAHDEAWWELPVAAAAVDHRSASVSPHSHHDQAESAVSES